LCGLRALSRAKCFHLLALTSLACWLLSSGSFPYGYKRVAVALSITSSHNYVKRQAEHLFGPDAKIFPIYLPENFSLLSFCHNEVTCLFLSQYFFKLYFIVVLCKGTMWHLQRILQYIKYIVEYNYQV
jgi:hypothetical protein